MLEKIPEKEVKYFDLNKAKDADMISQISCKHTNTIIKNPNTTSNFKNYSLGEAILSILLKNAQKTKKENKKRSALQVKKEQDCFQDCYEERKKNFI